MLHRIIEAVGAVQEQTGLEVACSLGLLTQDQAERLAAAFRRARSYVLRVMVGGLYKLNPVDP